MCLSVRPEAAVLSAAFLNKATLKPAKALPILKFHGRFSKDILTDLL